MIDIWFFFFKDNNGCLTREIRACNQYKQEMLLKMRSNEFVMNGVR